MRPPNSVNSITPNEIAEALGQPVSFLFSLPDNQKRFWHPPRLSITSSGKQRELDVPRPLMKGLLRKLHRFIQHRKLFCAAAHGAVRQRSSFSSAKCHLGTQVVAIRDVRNCYPSVSHGALRETLLQLGFRADTSRLLAGLFCCRGHLPQGAPTSGDALNLYLWDMDIQVLDFCGQDVTYTRMVDDHVLSGNDQSRVEEAAAFLEDRLHIKGLSVNTEKKSVNGLTISPQRQNVHSIGVNHPCRTRIPKLRCREYLEYAILFVKSAKCVSADSLPAVADKRRRLAGYINYCRQADKSPAKHLQRLLVDGDRIVCETLRRHHVTRSKKWWFKNKTSDRSIDLAKLWAAKKQGVVIRSATSSSPHSRRQFTLQAEAVSQPLVQAIEEFR